jgi:hypothetical protein
MDPDELHDQDGGLHRDAITSRRTTPTSPPVPKRSWGSSLTGGAARLGAFMSGNKTAGKHTWERSGQKAMGGLDGPAGEGLQAGLEAAEIHTPLHVAETVKHAGIMLQAGAHGLQKAAGIKPTGVAPHTREQLGATLQKIDSLSAQRSADVAETKRKTAEAKAAGVDISTEDAKSQLKSHVKVWGRHYDFKSGESGQMSALGHSMLARAKAIKQARNLGAEVRKAGHFSPQEASIAESEAMYGHHAERVYDGKDQHGKEKWLTKGPPSKKHPGDAPLPDVSPKSTTMGKVSKALEMPGNLFGHAADVIDGTGGEKELEQGKFGLAGAKSLLGIGGGAAKVVAAHTADAHGAVGLGGLAVSAASSLAAAPVRGVGAAYHAATGTKKMADAQRAAEKNEHWWGEHGSRRADLLESGMNARPSFDGTNHEEAGVPEDNYAKHGESYSEGAAAAHESLKKAGWGRDNIGASVAHDLVGGLGVLTAAKHGLSAMGSKAVLSAGTALGGMRGAAAGAWSNAKGYTARYASNAKHEVVHAAKHTWNGIKTTAGRVRDSYSRGAASAGESLARAGWERSAAGHGLSAVGSKAVLGAGKVFGGVGGLAGDAYANTKGYVTKKATGAWSAAKSGANWVGRKLAPGSA